MILAQDCIPENWVETRPPSEDPTVFKEEIRHRLVSLLFKIKFVPDQHYLEFEIWQGDRMLGASSSWGVPSIQAWKEDFLYRGNFNVFLSRQGVQMF